MTPREAVISVVERIERRLRQSEAFKESSAKDHALEAAVKDNVDSANLAKKNYAEAKIYEGVLKMVNEALHEELAELAKPEVQS
jgi:hypothetical protein